MLKEKCEQTLKADDVGEGVSEKEDPRKVGEDVIGRLGEWICLP